jgi:tetratricopeptide (TPR) repeat protein
VSAVGSRSQYSFWLLRPYLDLGPLEEGPLHARNVEACWRAFVEFDSPPFIPQRALPSGFREQLVDETGGGYCLSDPRQLPEDLRTDRWRILCEAVARWSDLSDDRKCRLASLLHSMCLYKPLLELIPVSDFFEAHGSAPHTIALAFWRASANFVQNLPARTAEYYGADISIFENIAINAIDAIPTGFNATTKVFVHKAKTGASVAELVAWSRRLETAMTFATRYADEFTAELLISRFYRAMGFLPQRLDDRNELVRLMDLSELHAVNMNPRTPEQQLLYRENLHAVMESRTKEALWLGDKDQALIRSLKVIEVDSYDSKAWVELGEVRYLREEWQEAAQAYATAAMLGPPASAVGRHMAGMCLRKLGQDLIAALFFKDTLEFDPVGISPRKEIHDLPDLAVLRGLKEWSRKTFEW